MKIGYGKFSVELSIDDICNTIQYVKEVLNMNTPFWIIIIFIAALYFYLWRQSISNWNNIKAINLLRGHIFSITERYCSDKNFDKSGRETMLDPIKSDDDFWGRLRIESSQDINSRPSILKPFKWRLFNE